MKADSQLEEFTINVNIKLALLWTAVMFFYIYGDYFELYVPGKVAGLVSGENMLDSPTKLFTAGILLTIPALMIFLSVMLKPAINKLLNIVFGIFYTALMLLIAFTSFTPWLTFYVFFAIVESIITSIIVWTAFTWPKNGSLSVK